MKECQFKNKHRRVVVEEGKMKATFSNPHLRNYTITRFDGCVVQNSLGADFIVSLPDVCDLIVELKGRGVEHAMKQVAATAKYLTDNRHRNGKLAGLIVSRQYPKENTIVQRGQIAFKRKFDARIQVCCGNREHDYDRLCAV